MLNSLCKVAAVVVSAGTGQRLGEDKTFLDLGGKPVIAWSLDILQGSGAINDIVLVLHKNSLDRGKKLVTERGWSKVISVCEGGRLRQDSVRNGLDRVKHSQYVLVHDGARPFLTNKLIDDGIESVKQTGAAVAAVPVKDTVKEVDETGLVAKTPKRSVLRMVQTPQVFRLFILREAYESIKGEYTDDSAIVEQAGYRVKVYSGDYGNIKITTQEDLIFAEMIAKRGSDNESRHRL